MFNFPLIKLRLLIFNDWDKQYEKSLNKINSLTTKSKYLYNEKKLAYDNYYEKTKDCKLLTNSGILNLNDKNSVKKVIECHNSEDELEKIYYNHVHEYNETTRELKKEENIMNFLLNNVEN